eukprot:3019158-Rhodomonas_salina.2
MWALSVLDEKALFVVFENVQCFAAAFQDIAGDVHLAQLHQTCITIDLSTEPASSKAASLRALMCDTSVARNKAIRSVAVRPSRMQVC